MTRIRHSSTVIDLATSKEVHQAANAPVRDDNWIPYLEQLIANRLFK